MPEAKDPRPPAPERLPSPIFDSHSHIDHMAIRTGMEPTREFVDQVMADARAVNVVRAITVADTIECARWCVTAAEWHPDVYAAVAIHPTEVHDAIDYDEIESLARHDRVVAVGETGLDYYWDRTDVKTQQEHFRRHIDLAKRVGKTLVIHDRDAHDDVLRILAEEGPPEQVVFHAFSGDAEMAGRCADEGYVMSFPGVVTFGNAPALREAAAVAPLDLVLVETDAPFLTPHPFRGRPNAPYVLPVTVRGLAAAMGRDLAELCETVTATGARVFGFPV